MLKRSLVGLFIVIAIVSGALTASAQSFNEPPLITGLQFPRIVPFEAVIKGSLHFRNPDADVVEFRCTADVPFGLAIQCLEPLITSDVEGSAQFLMMSSLLAKDYPPFTSEAMLHLSIMDSAGNSSVLDFPFSFVAKDQVLPTMIRRAAERTGLTFVRSKTVIVLDLSGAPLSRAMPYLRGEFDTAPARPKTMMEVLETFAYAPASKPNVEHGVVSSLALGRLAPGDKVILSRWIFQEGSVVSPALVDRYGVVKFDPILLRIITGVLAPSIDLVLSPDPQCSGLWQGELETIMTASFDCARILSQLEGQIESVLIRRDLAVAKMTHNLKEWGFDIQVPWLTWSAYRVDWTVFCVNDCLPSFQPGAACVQFQAHVAWAVPNIPHPFVPLKISFPGPGEKPTIDSPIVKGSDQYWYLILTVCADGTMEITIESWASANTAQ